MSDGRYPCVVTTTNAVNLRKLPGGELLESVEAGYYLAIESQSEYLGPEDQFKGTWYKFYDGYVMRKFTVPWLDKDCSITP